MFHWKNLIGFLFILFSIQLLASDLNFQKQCGKYQYIIEIDNPGQMKHLIIKHFYVKNGIKKMFHQTKNYLANIICLKNNNNSIFAFEEYHKEDAFFVKKKYGLFDPKQEKFLLKPSTDHQKNKAELINILGFMPNFSSVNLEKFCCVSQIQAINTYRKQCGNTTFLIVQDDNDFKFYYLLSQEKKLFYTSYTDYLHVSCAKAVNHNDYLLLQEICGGSACTDSGEYKIIDSKTKKFVLDKRANAEENAREAKKILGYIPSAPLEDEFCCTMK